MYALGIDVGTTFTAAAVWRDGQVRISSLGTRSASIPSVVVLRQDDVVLTGEAADRRAAAEPERVAREFKRRFGDSTPILLGGTPLSAEALTAHMLRSVVASVTERQGAGPAAVCITHPANWGPFKTDLLRQTVRLADISVPVRLVTEPEAAAVHYAQQERMEVGATIAVYDLGGGTFDAAVLRRTEDGFVVLGEPEGIERLGGMDVDAAVFDHVARTLGRDLTALDEDDPAAVLAMARLRRECREAKESLSADTDVSIPVVLPTVSTRVRLTRAELEAMLRPALRPSVGALRRTLRSAAISPEELSAVLLVGGSSRIPLVAELVGGELGRPVAVDADPKHDIALGAAWLAAEQLRTAPITAAPISPAPITPAPVSPQPITPAPVTPAPVTPAPVTAEPITPAPVTPEPLPPTASETFAAAPVPPTPPGRTGHGRPWWAAATAATAVVAIATAGAVYAVRAGDPPLTTGPQPGPTTSSGSRSGSVATPSGLAAAAATPVPLSVGTGVPPSSTTRSTTRVAAAAAPSTTPTTRTSTRRTTTATSSTRASTSSTGVRPPTAVTGLTASRGRGTGSTTTSIRVTWTGATGATSYLVEWRPAGTRGPGGSTTSSGGSTTIDGLLPGTRYTIRVTPRNTAGSGPAAVVNGATAA